MYNMLSLLTGVVIAVMVAVNGGLSQHYGIFIAAVIIHIVGVLFAFFLCVVLKRKISFKKLPLWLYTGGAIGVLTTVFNNFAFGRISMTSIVALGLLGRLQPHWQSIVLDFSAWKSIPLKNPPF